MRQTRQLRQRMRKAAHPLPQLLLNQATAPHPKERVPGKSGLPAVLQKIF